MERRLARGPDARDKGSGEPGTHLHRPGLAETRARAGSLRRYRRRMDEVWAGDVLLCFDGRVVEVFGFSGSESIRFHVRNLELEVGEPDRKGRRSVRIKPASRGSGGS